MTLKQIKAMFTPGQRWQCQRTGKSITIVGNVGNTALPPINVDEVRIVKAVRSADLVTTRPDGRPIYASWPKANEVQEARPGFVRWQYDNEVTITLTLLP
jgi:hypothetical protein